MWNVWHFKAISYQTVAMFIKCTSLKIIILRNFLYAVLFFRALFSAVSTCFGAAILFDKFWSACWIFERLGNVYGCEALAFVFI